MDREETHHLARVLRLGVGARVAVCDGRGRGAVAEVQEVGQEGAVLRLQEELAAPAESPLELVLALGLAKGDALERVVRQATEMGVTGILPFISTYSEKVTPERAARRAARWQKQAQEGLKSCQRLVLPTIFPVQEFSSVLEGPEEMKLLFYEAEREGGLFPHICGSRPAGVRVLIGPEGGFTPEEVAQARGADFQVVSLGPRRLRVETAALTAVALLQYGWGDLA